MIESEINSDDLSEEHKQQFRNLFQWYIKTTIDGPASSKLKKLIIDEWKATLNEVWHVEAKVQEFKMSEAFLESLPQFILQMCILIHEHPSLDLDLVTHKRMIATLSSSLLNVVSFVTLVFINMPQTINQGYIC